MKVVAYSMSNPDWQFIPGIQHYDQRSLISTPDEDIIVLSVAPDKGYLEYRERYLGFSPRRVIVCKSTGQNLCERMINDGTLPQRLRDARGHDEEMVLDPFIIMKWEEAVAAKLHLRLDGSAEITHELGSKSGFRRICKLSGVPVTPGTEYLTGDQLLPATRALFAENRDVDEVVIKGDWGASGTQQLRLRRADQSSFEWRILRYIADCQFTRGVVEVWEPDVLTSVGTHFVCTEDVQAVRGPWQQYLVNENEYAGTVFPAACSAQFRTNVSMQGQHLSSEYHAQSYRGHLGFDVIELPDGICRWVDCNARKGGVYSPQRFTELHHAQDKVVLARDVKHPNLRLLTFPKLLEQVKSDLFSVAHAHKNGIVFYNTGIMNLSKIQVLCLGDSLEQCQDYLKILERALTHAWV